MIPDAIHAGNIGRLAVRSARREPSSANSLGRVVLAACTAARLASGASLWSKPARAGCTPLAFAERYGMSSFLNVSRTGTRVSNEVANVQHVVPHADRPLVTTYQMQPKACLSKVFPRIPIPMLWCPYLPTEPATIAYAKSNGDPILRHRKASLSRQVQKDA